MDPLLRSLAGAAALSLCMTSFADADPNRGRKRGKKKDRGPAASAVIEADPCLGPGSLVRVLHDARRDLQIELEGQERTTDFGLCAESPSAFLAQAKARARAPLFAYGLPGGPWFDLQQTATLAEVDGALRLRATFASKRVAGAWALDLALVDCPHPRWKLRVDPSRSTITGQGAFAGQSLQPVNLARCGFLTTPRQSPRRLLGVFAFCGSRVGLATLQLELSEAQCLEAEVEALGLTTGSHVLRVSQRGRLLAQATLEVDRSGPTLSGSVDPSGDPIAVQLDYSDPGCAEIDPASFRASLDGVDVSSSFSVGAARAEGSLPRPPPGGYELTLSLSDTLGNSSQVTLPFRVESPATSFELRLSPGAGQQASVGAAYDLVVRAVGAEGETATAYEGPVTLVSSNPAVPLQGVTLQFRAEDAGSITLPSLARFPLVETVTVRAISLDGSAEGELLVSVVAREPAISPAPPSYTQGPLAIVGASYPGQLVRLVVNGQVVATTTAGPDGSYRFDPALTEGTYSIRVEGFDPALGAFQTSATSTVSLDQSVAPPQLLRPRAGGVVTYRATLGGTAEPGADVELFEGSTLLSSATADAAGRFELELVSSASGTRILRARATDLAGNVSALSDPYPVQVGGSPLLLEVLDGSSRGAGPLAGLPVEIDGQPVGVTDSTGRFAILDAGAGPRVVSVAGEPEFVRLEVALSPSADAVASKTLRLARVPAGIAQVVTLSAGAVQVATTVQSPLVPGGAIEIPAGTTVGGATSDTPALALFPVNAALTPAPFPSDFTPSRLYELHPSGLTFSPGLTVRLPNHEDLAPGTQRPIYGYKADQGGWAQLGTATVDPSGEALVSDTPFVTGFSLFGYDDGGAPVTTTFRLRLQGVDGGALSGLADPPELNGVLMEDQGAGLYTLDATVSPDQPIRVFARFPLGSGTLDLETSPELADPGTTELNGGQPFRPSLEASLAGVAAGCANNDPQPTGTIVSHARVGYQSAPTGNIGVAPYRVEGGTLGKLFPQGGYAPEVSFRGLPEGSALAPNTRRFLPLVLRLRDLDGETSTSLVSLEFEVAGSGTWQPAAVAGGDPLSPLSAPSVGNDYLLVWDSRAATGVGSLPSATSVRVRARFQDLGGLQSELVASEPFFLADAPFELVSNTPEEGAIEVSQTASLRLTFSSPVDPATTGATILTAPLAGGFTTALEDGGHTLVIRPGSRMPPGVHAYGAEVTLQSTSGVSLANRLLFSFEVGGDPGELDEDGDGLLASEELAYGTSDNAIDTDGDGVPDAEEIFERFTPPSEPNLDGDGQNDFDDPTPLGEGAPADPNARPFVVAGLNPPVGSRGADLNTDIVVTFNEPVDLSTIDPATNLVAVGVTATGFVNIDWQIVLPQSSPNSVRLRPDAPLPADAGINISVFSSVLSLTGKPYEGVFRFAFSTSAATLFEVDDFEQTHYMEGLAYSKWERFPLTAPTAGGRNGYAMVVPSTGCLLLQETDFVLPGRKTSVALTRTYRSNEGAQDGIFGRGWHCNYDMRFTVVEDVDGDGIDDFEHVSADGRTFFHLRRTPGDVNDTESPPGFYESLHQVPDPRTPGEFLLKQRQGTGTAFYYEFFRGPLRIDPNDVVRGDVGRLVRITDTNLNHVEIKRFGASQANAGEIETITDDRGRETRFVYRADPGQERLVEAVRQDWGGRAWSYDYDASGRLIEVAIDVQRPETFSAPSSVVRKGRRYSYVGATRSLSQLFDGKGQATLRVFYDPLTDLVNQVDYGLGEDAGTAVYSFERRDAAGALAAAYTATQVDRNGHVNVIEHTDPVPQGGPCVRSTVSASRVMNEDLNGSATDLTDFLVAVECNDRGRVIKVTWAEELIGGLPVGTCVCFVRRPNDCDQPIQVIWKASGGDPLLESVEDDIVWVYEYGGPFHELSACIEPRGNNGDFVGNSPIVDQPEDVSTGTPRTFRNFRPAERERYTTRIYYDHEDIVARVAQDNAAVVAESGIPGTYVSVAGLAPPSFGRPSGGNGAPGSEFADGDGDGFPDRGRNPILIRGPNPRVVDAANPSVRVDQTIESYMAYNQFGQRYLEIEPDGDRNRYAYYQGGPHEDYLRETVLGTEFTPEQFDTVTGEAPGLETAANLVRTVITDYTPFGQVREVQNPRGYSASMRYDSLDLLVGATTTAPFSYQRSFLYDENNNLVETLVQDVVAQDADGSGIQEGASEQTARGAFRHTTDYNSVNMPVAVHLDATAPGDTTPTTLSSFMRYDRKQLLVAVREPEGNIHTREHDERDLLLRTTRGASDPATATSVTLLHDDMGRVKEVYDQDEAANQVHGTVPGSVIDYLRPAAVYTYDAFSRVIATSNELEHEQRVVYDVRHQVIETTAHERTPANTFALLARTRTGYDEAGRPFQVSRDLFDRENPGADLLAEVTTPRLSGPNPGELGVRNPGDIPTPLDLWNAPQGWDPTTAADPFLGRSVHSLVVYDAEGKVRAAIDDNLHRTSMGYDEVDRVTETTDAAGNVTRLTYDANSNVVRLTQEERSAPLPGGEDRGLETYYGEVFYDELDRVIARVSHQGNTSRFLYDSRGNVVQASDAQAGPAGLELDALEVQPGEHGAYPQSALGVPPATRGINARGNTVRMVYDGISRPLERIEDLRQGGTGDGAVVDAIVTRTLWDRNSRRLSNTDPNGNTTLYAYDQQNRNVRERFADGTSCRYSYNRVGTLATKVDPRGVVESYVYDEIERLARTEISNVPGSGVNQNSLYRYTYDGLNRQLSSSVTNTSGFFLSTNRKYDSFSRVIEERQSSGATIFNPVTGTSRNTGLGVSVARSFDGVGNVLVQAYPGADSLTPGRRVQRRYDELNRLVSIADATTASPRVLSEFSHQGGGGRRLQRRYADPALTCTLDYDPSRRVTQIEDRQDFGGGPQRLNGWRYGWDRVGNRRYEQELSSNVPGDLNGQGQAYRYDSIYRLVHEGRDVDGVELQGLLNNAAPAAAPVLGAGESNSWSFDGAGNRVTASSDLEVTSYVQAAGFPSADREVNQYTQILTGGVGRTREHDAAGNLLREDTAAESRREFDHANRLVRSSDSSSGEDVRYTYDPEGRRRAKTEVGSNAFFGKFFVWDGWQCIAEYEIVFSFGSGRISTRLVNEFVYGEGLDEVVFAEVLEPSNSGSPFSPVRRELFYCHNSLGSVTAVVGESSRGAGDWAVVERYRYGAYGETTVLNPDRTEKAGQVPVQPYAFTGRRLGWEEGGKLYYYRLRYYDPEAGRFISRDPLGMWGDPGQRGNPQNYCGNNPVNRVDPMGLQQATTNAQAAAVLGGLLNDYQPHELPPGVYDGWAAAYEQYSSAQTGPTLQVTSGGFASGAATQASATSDRSVLGAWAEGFWQGFSSKETEARAWGIVAGVTVGLLVGWAALPGLTGGYLALGLWGTGAASGLTSYMVETAVSPTAELSGKGIVTSSVLGGNLGLAFGALGLAASALSRAVSGASAELTTVVRFYTASEPATLMPNVSRAPVWKQWLIWLRMRSPSYRNWRADRHMKGDTKDSPFVSVLLDPEAGAASTDPWLRTIITGRPGVTGVQRAPDMGTFDVPAGNLIGPRPGNRLSLTETEMVAHGVDLSDCVQHSTPNPYR